jgi:phosphatidylglycerophosphate synthase
MIGMFIYFSVRTVLGRQPQVEGLRRRKFTDIFGPFLTAYLLWLIHPIERAFIAARVSPNAITAGSLLLCAIAGTAVATGYLAMAAWVYIFAGMLDILDGRLARATNRSSQAGAFLDSVSDRWGELLVFSGFVWHLRSSPWLGAVMLAVAGSVMVSYTRARGEGLGLKLDGGTMQRAERIALVSVGTLFAAWLDAASNTSEYGVYLIGGALLITGLGSTVTAVGRWMQGYRILEAREREASEEEARARQPVGQPAMVEQGNRLSVGKPASQMVISGPSQHGRPAGDIASVR